MRRTKESGRTGEWSDIVRDEGGEIVEQEAPQVSVNWVHSLEPDPSLCLRTSLKHGIFFATSPPDFSPEWASCDTSTREREQQREILQISCCRWTELH